MTNAHVTGAWIFAACCVLAIGYANQGPNRWEIEALGRKEAAVELAKHGASALIVNCILDPPKLSYYCVEAMKAERRDPK
jgi:hypothetical protein